MLKCDEKIEPEYRLVVKGRILQAVGLDKPFVYDKTFETKQEADEQFTLFMNHFVRVMLRGGPKSMSDANEEEKRSLRLLSECIKPHLVEGVLPPKLIIPKEEIAQIVGTAFSLHLNWVKADINDVAAFKAIMG